MIKENDMIITKNCHTIVRRFTGVRFTTLIYIAYLCCKEESLNIATSCMQLHLKGII